MSELGKLREELDKHKVEAADDRKERQNKTLHEKQREVEEKIRKGEKLTTEDLIILQGTDN